MTFPFFYSHRLSFLFVPFTPPFFLLHFFFLLCLYYDVYIRTQSATPFLPAMPETGFAQWKGESAPLEHTGEALHSHETVKGKGRMSEQGGASTIKNNKQQRRRQLNLASKTTDPSRLIYGVHPRKFILAACRRSPPFGLEGEGGKRGNKKVADNFPLHNVYRVQMAQKEGRMAIKAKRPSFLPRRQKGGPLMHLQTNLEAE